MGLRLWVELRKRATPPAKTIVPLIFGMMVKICGLKENPRKRTLIS